MQVHSRRWHFVMLLVFPFIVGMVKVALASPLHTPHSISRFEHFESTSKDPNNIHTSHSYQNHAAFTHTNSGQRLATVVQLETWRVQLHSITEIVTEIIEQTTKLPTSLVLSDLGTGQAHTFAPRPSAYDSAGTSITLTKSPTSSTGIYTVSPKTTPTLVVDTDLGSSPTALPQTATERRFFELPTATLIGVAVSGSVAANLFIIILWILLRQRYLRKVIGTAAAEGVLGPTGDTENERSSSQRDMVQITRGGIPGLLGPRGTSPVELDINPPPSTHQAMPQSSFWSAASSQWTVERARSHGDGVHRDALDRSLHFTMFNLDTPVNPELNSPTPTDAPKTTPESVHRMSRPSVDSSFENEQDNQTPTVPSAFRQSCGEYSTDPRSPRHLSIPMFMEDYSSPSVSHYLPPHTQSTMNTSERASYGLDVRGCFQDRESSQRVVEHELGYSSVAASATSLTSLPSVSSEIMTPRRHWTFVDIHGPSSHTASLQELDGIIDRFSGTGSSQTLAGDNPGASRGLFERGSSSFQLEAAFPEPSGADSFLHTDFGNPSGSTVSQNRSTDARRDTLHSFNHHDSIHTH